jgi:hypothetical protein
MFVSLMYRRAPDRIRTCAPLIKSQQLYQTELRRQSCIARQSSHISVRQRGSHQKSRCPNGQRTNVIARLQCSSAPKRMHGHIRLVAPVEFHRRRLPKSTHQPYSLLLFVIFMYARRDLNPRPRD